MWPCSEAKGFAVKIYLNHRGQFAETPDGVISLPDLEGASQICIAPARRERNADFLISGNRCGSVLLIAQKNKVAYRAVSLPSLMRASSLLADDFNGDGKTDQAVFGTTAEGVQGAYIYSHQ
jgi:hypothetical protein